MTGKDADEIIRLRDIKKLSWYAIGNHVGYDKRTCENHYKLRKQGKKYTNDEFKEFISQIDTTSLSVREISEILVQNNFPISPSYTNHLLKKFNIPFRRSRRLTELTLREAKDLFYHHHFSPYDALRCVYEGNEPTFKYLLTKLENEILNEQA